MINQIVANFISANNHVFDIDEEAGTEYDYTQTYIVPVNIDFYGIDEELDETEITDIYDGNYSKADKIAKLFGYLILCSKMLDDGYSPLMVCDDLDGDLEHTISALTDKGGPLNENDGDPFRNVCYIHELDMKPNYNSPQLFNRIIAELPYLIKEFIHIEPEILAYYIAPTSDEWRKEIEDSNFILRKLAMQKVSCISEDSVEDSDNLFAKYYNFTDDEINKIMGRRNSSSGYPEEYKDFEKFNLYKGSGFEELEETRLMYKNIKI